MVAPSSYSRIAPEEAAARFLSTVFRGDPPGDILLWQLPDKRSTWCQAHQLSGLAAVAQRVSATRDVYIGVGLRDLAGLMAAHQAAAAAYTERTGKLAEPPKPYQVRGGAESIRTLVGLWAEVDFADPVHAATALPPDADAARALIAEFPLPPTIVVHSGHGLQAWWLFHEPWELETEDERREAAILAECFQATLQEHAQAHGWHMDSTHDLARVLRIPGTWNRKTDPPVPVELHECDDTRRYNPSDFGPYLIDREAAEEVRRDYAPPAGDWRPVALAPAVAACAWLRHCRDDAATLPEPEWYAMLSIVGRTYDGVATTHEWSQPHPGYSAVETEAKLRHALTAAGPRTCKSIRRQLNGEAYCAACPSWGKIKSPLNPVNARLFEEEVRPPPNSNGNGHKADVPPPPNEQDGGAPPDGKTPVAELDLTDMGNAALFVTEYGADWRFCHPWKSWLKYVGTHWERDERGRAMDAAKSTVRLRYCRAQQLLAEAEALAETNPLAAGKLAAAATAQTQWAKKSAAAPRVSAALQLAQSEPGIPVSPSELNRDPMLFNVRNGTIDLRTGLLLPHDRSHLITKVAPVEYDPHASCPRFLAFLETIMAGRQELIDFLQRAIGYSLTADTCEQVLFILYGLGSNGKSTLLDVCHALLGDYAKNTPFETFLHRDRDVIRNDLAALFGSRFVSASEIEPGQRLSEGLVKSLTGSDPVTARFLFQESFTFVPTFKIWLSCNHKPTLRGTDHAMWRRIRLIPCTVQIPDDQQDKQLLSKLCAELPGILAWAVRGCQRWLAEGLGLPEAIKEATQAYREEMDTLGDFLGEWCVLDEQAYVPAAQLYKVYLAWCEAENEPAMSAKALGLRLRERGFTDGRVGKPQQRVWRGLRLRGTIDE